MNGSREDDVRTEANNNERVCGVWTDYTPFRNTLYFRCNNKRFYNHDLW